MAVRLNTIPPLFLRSLFIFIFSLAFCASASCLHSKASCSCRNTAKESLKNIPGLTLLHSFNPQCTPTHPISVYALLCTGNCSCGFVFVAPTHARMSFKRDLTHNNIWSSICVSASAFSTPGLLYMSKEPSLQTRKSYFPCIMDVYKLNCFWT